MDDFKKSLKYLKSKNKLINIPKLVAICAIITIVIFVLVFVANDFIFQYKYAVMIKNHNLVIKEKDEIIEQYRKEYVEVIDIRDAYRNNFKEIVALLYNKDMPIGGSPMDENYIEENDQVILRYLRNQVLSLQDDLRLQTEVKNYLTSRKEFSDNFPFIWPTKKGGVPNITSRWGFRDNEEVFKKGKQGFHFHAGIDIPGDMGEPIVATAEGVILKTIYNDEIYGNYIIIRHKYGFETKYAHLSRIMVTKNQVVQRGEQIGQMGNTGFSLGVHVHYEIRKDGSSVDPMIFLTTNY